MVGTSSSFLAKYIVGIFISALTCTHFISPFPKLVYIAFVVVLTSGSESPKLKIVVYIYIYIYIYFFFSPESNVFSICI